MRLFVALEPPPTVLAAVEQAVAPHHGAWPELRWVGRERWHVTLGFLGEVAEETVPCLAERLGNVAGRHRAQRVAFAGAGAFPSRARARVLWVGMDLDQQAQEALGQLVGDVLAAARECGIEPAERQRFHAHLTLARCRQPTDLRPLVEELSGHAGSPWTAGAIHLIRSHPGPKPWYETLHSWELTSS